MSSPIRPLPGYVVVTLVEKKDPQTKSGLFIPEKTGERMRFTTGKIVAKASEMYVGGAKDYPLQIIPMEGIEINDVVVFERAFARDLVSGGEKYFCVAYKDIYGVVEGGEDAID